MEFSQNQPSQSQNFDASLRLIQKCPSCNVDYQGEAVQVLREGNDSCLAYYSCPSCDASVVARIMQMPHGLIGNAIVTDCNPEEVMRFSGESDVDFDDVLRFHQQSEN